jgi:hypothetical protein
MTDGEVQPAATGSKPVGGNSAGKERTLDEVFASIEEIRKHVKPLPKGVTIKDLIEEGRK